MAYQCLKPLKLFLIKEILKSNHRTNTYQFTAILRILARILLMDIDLGDAEGSTNAMSPKTVI